MRDRSARIVAKSSFFLLFQKLDRSFGSRPWRFISFHFVLLHIISCQFAYFQILSRNGRWCQVIQWYFTSFLSISRLSLMFHVILPEKSFFFVIPHYDHPHYQKCIVAVLAPLRGKRRVFLIKSFCKIVNPTFYI